MQRNEKREKIEINKEFLSHVLDYFIHQQGHLLMEMQANRTDDYVRTKILSIARTQFELLGVKKDIDSYVTYFETYIWGYYLLDPLINEESISDIRCYDYNRIRITRYGKKEEAKIEFPDYDDYRRFIGMVATKNEVNLSAINEIQKFTDYTSNSDYILRFNICYNRINTSNKPFMHIRKTPRKKRTLTELENIGFLTKEQREYLQEKAKTAKGIYFTGKGSAGKTTLFNALIEEIPRDKSGLVIQESDELFSDHPDILFQHILEQNGEGKVQYGMKELAQNGLLINLDYYMIGEIKGEEAEYFSLASYTGHTCWASGHGASPEDGIEKLKDYIQRATGNTEEACFKVLSQMEVVVFLKDYRIQAISEIRGYQNGQLLFEPIWR